MTPRETIASWIKDSLTALDCAQPFIDRGRLDDRPDLVIRLDHAKTELEAIYREIAAPQKEVKP